MTIELGKLEAIDESKFKVEVTDVKADAEGDREGKLIAIEFEHQRYDVEDETHMIQFELYIPERFPFKFPQLLCLTDVSP